MGCAKELICHLSELSELSENDLVVGNKKRIFAEKLKNE